MDLSEKIRQSQIDKARKYPLLDISDNRAEIREISQNTQHYLNEKYPELKQVKLWEAIPRMVIEFLRASLSELDKSDALTKGESAISIGDLFDIVIQYTATPDGDKFGNLTPVIRCKTEFRYEDKDLPYNDVVTIEEAATLREEQAELLPAQFFSNRVLIKKISLTAWKSLADNYGIFTVEAQWWLLPLVVLAFFRMTKEWLIAHKDDGEFGIEINFADLLKISIAKEGGLEEDDPVDYILSITPNQVFKKDFAKSDEVTEK